MPGTRILITGGSGFLGWNLLRILGRKGYSVTGTRHRTPPDTRLDANWVKLDLLRGDIAGSPRPLSPSLIIHCAAVSKRSDCDRDPERARRVNVLGTERLARFAASLDVPLVFISTDLVFDGTRAPYSEEDERSPASVYARTKAEAERVIERTWHRHYIVRTALMYGRHRDRPGSFLSWTVAGLKARDLPPLYTNQFRTPLYAEDVAQLIHGLFSRHAPYGIYHAAGPDRLSRHGMGIAVAGSLGTDERCITAKRLEREPPFGDVDDTSLNTEKAQRAANMSFTSFAEGMKKLEKVLYLERLRS